MQMMIMGLWGQLTGGSEGQARKDGGETGDNPLVAAFAEIFAAAPSEPAKDVEVPEQVVFAKIGGPIGALGVFDGAGLPVASSEDGVSAEAGEKIDTEIDGNDIPIAEPSVFQEPLPVALPRSSDVAPRDLFPNTPVTAEGKAMTASEDAAQPIMTPYTSFAGQAHFPSQVAAHPDAPTLKATAASHQVAPEVQQVLMPTVAQNSLRPRTDAILLDRGSLNGAGQPLVKELAQRANTVEKMDVPLVKSGEGNMPRADTFTADAPLTKPAASRAQQLEKEHVSPADAGHNGSIFPPIKSSASLGFEPATGLTATHIMPTEIVEPRSATMSTPILAAKATQFDGEIPVVAPPFFDKTAFPKSTNAADVAQTPAPPQLETGKRVKATVAAPLQSETPANGPAMVPKSPFRDTFRHPSATSRGTEIIPPTTGEPESETAPTAQANTTRQPVSEMPRSPQEVLTNFTAAPATDSGGDGAGVALSPDDTPPIMEIGQTPASGQKSDSVPTSPNMPKADMPARVIAQIADAARHLPDRPIEITLSPEELGKVRMSLQISDSGGMSVVIAAERAETVDLLRRNMDSLMRDFHSLGYENSGFSFQEFHQQNAQDHDQNAKYSSGGNHENAAHPDLMDAPPDPVRLSLSTNSGMDIRL